MTKAAPKAKVVIPTAKDYLRELRELKGVEDEDYAMFDDELAWTSPVKEYLSTGSIGIDKLLGGGWPIGRIVEVAAWEGVGKSTLLDQSLASCQEQKGIGVLIDTEQARDDRYTARLGVDLSALIVRKGLTIEDAFSGIDHVIAIQEAHAHVLAKKGLKPPPTIIVWDSLGGTPTRGEFDGAADDHHVSEAARNVKMNLRRIASRISKLRMCLVIANHFYQSIGPFASLNSYGGSGIRYFTSVRLWLTKTESIKVGDSIVGHVIQAKLKKTRVGVPRPPIQVGLLYGAGVHNGYSLFEWCKTNGIIVHKGQWSYLTKPDGVQEQFQKSFIGFGELLQAQPDLYTELVTRFMSEGVP